MGALIMILKMFLIMGTILIVGFVCAIWGLRLSAVQASRHGGKLLNRSEFPIKFIGFLLDDY